MRSSTHTPFALALAGLAGCTTVRDFCGSAKNLKGDGERIPPGTHRKTTVTCCGGTRSGERYIALGLRAEHCWFVLFHPPANASGSFYATTASGTACAWLVRGKKPDCAALGSSGRDASFLTPLRERLHGTISGLWYTKNDFHFDVELVGANSETSVEAQFAAYTALWKPLIGPAMLLGFGGARAVKP